MDGDVGFSQWLNTSGQAVLDFTPEFAVLDGGSVFDFNTPLDEVTSEDSNLIFSSARSYAAKESSFASYAQIETEAKLFNVPVYLNFGVRAVQTKNELRGFTGVDQWEPINNITTTVDDAAYYVVDNSRLDVIPSFNAKFRIRKNFQYRLSIARGVSRPRYRDMIPNNDIEYLDPESPILDPTSADYEPDLRASLYRGTISSGNPNLLPYTAWMYDNTFEYYVKNGGQFRASIFYKDIKNYIGRQTIVNQPYPGEEVLGVALPAAAPGFDGQENYCLIFLHQ